MITEEEAKVLEAFTDNSEEKKDEQPLEDNNQEEETEEESEEEGINEGEEDAEEQKEDDEPTEDEGDDTQALHVEVAGQKIKITEEDVLRLLNHDEKREETDLELMVEQFNLSEDDLAIIRDIKEGNTNALLLATGKTRDELIEELAEKDEEDKDYKPDTTIKKDTEIAKEARKISENEETKKIFEEATTYVTDEFYNAVVSSPEILRDFRLQIEAGVALPATKRAKAMTKLNGKNFAENYIISAQQIVAEQNTEKDKKREKVKKTLSNLKGTGETKEKSPVKSKDIVMLRGKERKAAEEEILARFK